MSGSLESFELYCPTLTTKGTEPQHINIRILVHNYIATEVCVYWFACELYLHLQQKHFSSYASFFTFTDYIIFMCLLSQTFSISFSVLITISSSFKLNLKISNFQIQVGKKLKVLCKSQRKLCKSSQCQVNMTTIVYNLQYFHPHQTTHNPIQKAWRLPYNYGIDHPF